MIDALINRIKDAYFDLDRDTRRLHRFEAITDQYQPGAIMPSPSQLPAPGMVVPEQGMPAPAAPAAPPPSILDRLAAER